MFKKPLVYLSILLIVSFSGAKSLASPLDYLNPDFYLGHSIAAALNLAGTAGYDQYRIVTDPKLSARLEKAKQLIIKQAPFYNYRFKNIDLVVVQGVDGEPNAFSLGPVIFVTQSLGKIFNDRQLTAVLAHEIAHSQKGHLVQRIPMPLGAAIYEAAQILKNGKVDSLQLKKFVEMVRGHIETVHLATEIQADCLAANQLNHLHQRGFPNNAYDLVDATNVLYGEDVTQLKEDFGDPGIIRAKIIKSNQFALIGCNIF